MRKRSIYLLPMLLLINTIAGCKYSENFRVMDTDHFVVDMPPYLSKVSNLHPKAPVQGRNDYRDVYFLVIEHPRSATDSAFAMSLDTIAGNISTTVRDPFKEMDSTYTVNGLQTIHRRLTGTIKDKRLVFTVALVRGKNFDYEISAWMFDNKRGLWQKDIQQAIMSFKEK